MWGWDWVTQGSRLGLARATQGSPMVTHATICESAFVCNENQKMTGWGVR
jgi:hypothetical protein